MGKMYQSILKDIYLYYSFLKTILILQFRMDCKQIPTNQSLQTNNSIDQIISIYGNDDTDVTILSTTLKGFDIEDENCIHNLHTLKEQLQQTLQNIDNVKKNTFGQHNAIEKFNQCVNYFQQGKQYENNGQILQKSMKTHHNFITNIEEKINILLSKIKKWRENKQILQKLKNQKIRINKLFLKKYNITNFVQQMDLVKEMIVRVNERTQKGNCDFHFIDQLMNKTLIPYSFYHQYCYNVICRNISKRMQQNQLIVIKKNQFIGDLFTHMQQYYFKNKDLYQQCNIFLLLSKTIRIINDRNISIEDGFCHFFKPYLLNLLSSSSPIDSTNFLKSRSLMQCQQNTIDIWCQFQNIIIQKYILWNYQQQNFLKKSELVHLIHLKQTITTFKTQYSWINRIGLKNIRIQGDYDFVKEFIKLGIIKIISPILLVLYRCSIPEQSTKSYEKKKIEFNNYWYYTIFGKYKQLFYFFRTQIETQINAKIKKHSEQSNEVEDSQLNNDQYFKYYQQMAQIIKEELNNKQVSEQFTDFWEEIWVRYCFSKSILNQKGMNASRQSESFEIIKKVSNNQRKLQQILNDKKNLKKQETIDQLQGIILNLHFKSTNFFLLHSALKNLPKSLQKQINSIRSVAYTQLFA